MRNDPTAALFQQIAQDRTGHQQQAPQQGWQQQGGNMNWPMQIVGDRNGYTATPYMPGPSLAGLQFGRQAGFDLGSAINNAYNGATMRAIGQQYAANPVIMQNQRSNMLQNTLPQILSALGGSMGSLGQGGVNTDYGASVRGPKPTDTAKYNTGLNSLLSAFA